MIILISSRLKMMILIWLRQTGDRSRHTCHSQPASVNVVRLQHHHHQGDQQQQQTQSLQDLTHRYLKLTPH